MKILKENIETTVMKVEMDVKLESKNKINLEWLRKFIGLMNLYVYYFKLYRDDIEYEIDSYDIENNCEDTKTFNAYLKEFSRYATGESINLSRKIYDSWEINFYDNDDNYDFVVKYDNKNKNIHVEGTIDSYNYGELKKFLTAESH